MIQKRTPRREMKPGQIFGVERTIRARGYGVTRRSAHIVIDAATEIDFWTGRITTYGDVAPADDFEILSSAGRTPDDRTIP